MSDTENTTIAPATMTPENAKSLRKPFPKESIGYVPKPKSGIRLAYVGHAAVTDRLLAVDPLWNWEPLGVDEHGLPAHDKLGNLWIKLTICGVTRLGIGDGQSEKEKIGDAIRNAAMRFGVALDLWAKEDLVAFAQAADQNRAGTPHVTWADFNAALKSTGLKKPDVLTIAAELFNREVTSLQGLAQTEVDQLTAEILATTTDVTDATDKTETAA